MTTTKKNTGRITLRTVLEHVQALHGEMMMKFAGVDKRFEAVDLRFESFENRLNDKIDGVERRLTRQIDGLDKRLDDIGIVQIPKLKKTVGAR